MIKELVLNDLYKSIAFIALYLIIFLLAKILKDLFTPYKLNEELTQKDNLAIALTMSGYYFGVLAVFCASFYGPSNDLLKDLTLVGGYSLLGVFFLNISRFFNDKIILRKFCNIEQLTVHNNIAVGFVQFAMYVATGIIAAGSLTGQGGGILTAIVFFLLGQMLLLLFSFLYNLILPYHIVDELEKKNTAAAIAFGGNLIALSIIVFNATSGNFIGWAESLIYFFVVSLIAVIFLPLIRLLMDRLVVPGDKLSQEIIEDKNIGAGLLEATVAISFALVLKLLF